MDNIIIKPHITEKSFAEAEKGRYTFVVAKHATKTDVKREVQKLFSVTVTRIATNIVKGTKTRFTKRGRNITDLTYKKARVTLKKGEKIEIFEEKTK